MYVNAFLSGAIMAAATVAALFFVQYWKRSHDRLFAILALAFALFSVERIALALVALDEERRHWIFVFRLVAFLLIIIAILDKNRRRRGSTRTSRPA
jgi:hypothetical protein